jgi:hypothetical protein
LTSDGHELKGVNVLCKTVVKKYSIQIKIEMVEQFSQPEGVVTRLFSVKPGTNCKLNLSDIKPKLAAPRHYVRRYFF